MANPRYHLRQAALCLRQSPYAAAMAALTVAVSLAVAGAAWASVRAVEATLRAYGADARITVFLDQTAPGDGPILAVKAAEAAGSGASAVFVPPDAALTRLRADLGDVGEALDALATNPLPASIEVKLSGAQLAQGDLSEVRAAAERLAKLSFAKEVDYGKQFVERLELLLSAVRAVGLFAFAFVVGLALFLVGSVVRLTVYARRDEIDVLRLVGATDGFIAVPFVLEGAMQGLVGGAAAAVMSGLGEAYALPKLATMLGFAAALLPEPVGAAALTLFVPLGCLLGLVAAYSAVLRFLRKSK